MFVVSIIFTICLHYTNGATLDDLLLTSIAEDGRLELCDLANKYNMKCVRYNVTTEDGYILGLFNIPGDRTKPVLIKHGFAAAADVYLVRANQSWVAYLAEKGYDVWLGNSRGNMHSRAHVSLNPDGLKFWDFSFHEIAKYDLPAMTDFILNITGQKQISAISHSEGTTFFFALGVLRPEYNDKFKVVIALAPVAYLHNAGAQMYPFLPSNFFNPLLPLSSYFGYGEIFNNSSLTVSLIKLICTNKDVGYILCVEGFISQVMGRDLEQLEPGIAPAALARYPSGTSAKDGIHLLQLGASKRFAQYDYGYAKNLLMYNSTRPPKYDLRKNTMKIAIVVGKNDKLSVLKDAEILRKQLPNIVEYHVMKPKNWNHASFVWGKYMREHLFNYVHDILKKNS